MTSSSFKNYLKSFDDYGATVKVNFKGAMTFQTWIGAILTFARVGLVLTFAVAGLISLITYQNPQITQYRVFENRNDNKELNLGASHGEFIFGFLNYDKAAFVPIDPTICTFRLESVSVDVAKEFEIQVHEDHELTAVSKASHPVLFENDSAVNGL